MLNSRNNKVETTTAGISMNQNENILDSHISFNMGKTDFQTNYDRDYNVNKDMKPNTQKGFTDLKKDLTANHFKLGSNEQG